MKTLLISVLVATLFSATSIYDFKVPGLDGNIDFAAFKGKKIMIVNTASECGNTPQYKDLETLYEQHKGELVIVGFPANNFGGQEPGSNKEIKEFCSSKYAITFPMAEKISVKGNDIHPLYKFLKEQAAAKGLQDPVTWNFGKFLLNEKGELVATFSPRTEPNNPEIQKWFN